MGPIIWQGHTSKKIVLFLKMYFSCAGYMYPLVWWAWLRCFPQKGTSTNCWRCPGDADWQCDQDDFGQIQGSIWGAVGGEPWLNIYIIFYVGFAFGLIHQSPQCWSIQGSNQWMTCPTWTTSRMNGPMRRHVLWIFCFPPSASGFHMISSIYIAGHIFIAVRCPPISAHIFIFLLCIYIYIYLYTYI